MFGEMKLMELQMFEYSAFIRHYLPAVPVVTELLK